MKVNPNSKHKSRKSGQALVEYVLLLASAAAISIAFFSFFNSFIGQGLLTFGSVLESEVRTGSFENQTPMDAWEN